MAGYRVAPFGDSLGVTFDGALLLGFLLFKLSDGIHCVRALGVGGFSEPVLLLGELHTLVAYLLLHGDTLFLRCLLPAGDVREFVVRFLPLPHGFLSVALQRLPVFHLGHVFLLGGYLDGDALQVFLQGVAGFVHFLAVGFDGLASEYVRQLPGKLRQLPKARLIGHHVVVGDGTDEREQESLLVFGREAEEVGHVAEQSEVFFPDYLCQLAVELALGLLLQPVDVVAGLVPCQHVALAARRTAPHFPVHPAHREGPAVHVELGGDGVVAAVHRLASYLGFDAELLPAEAVLASPRKGVGVEQGCLAAPVVTDYHGVALRLHFDSLVLSPLEVVEGQRLQS